MIFNIEQINRINHMSIKITINSQDVKNPLIRFILGLIGLVIFIVVIAVLFFLILPLVWFAILYMLILASTLWVVLPKLILTYRTMLLDRDKLDKE